MKTKIYLIVILFVPIFVFGQNIRKELSEVKVTPPAFKGVEEVIEQAPVIQSNPLGVYLSENFKYPAVDADYLVEGTGVIRFKVTPEGELTNFEVINSVSRDIDNEFIKILKTTNGLWKPGYNNSTPTTMEKEVSMMFVIDQPAQQSPREYFIEKAKRYFTLGSNWFFTKGNPQKALKLYDAGIKYMPNETSLLMLRGLCKYELGDEKGATDDWNRIATLGGKNADNIPYNLSALKGYDEMKEILATSEE